MRDKIIAWYHVSRIFVSFLPVARRGCGCHLELVSSYFTNPSVAYVLPTHGGSLNADPVSRRLHARRGGQWHREPQRPDNNHHIPPRRHESSDCSGGGITVLPPFL